MIHKHQQNIAKKGKQHGQIYVRYRDLLFDISGFEIKHPREYGHDKRFCNQDQLVKVQDNGKDMDECIYPEEKYKYPICFLICHLVYLIAAKVFPGNPLYRDQNQDQKKDPLQINDG